MKIHMQMDKEDLLKLRRMVDETLEVLEMMEETEKALQEAIEKGEASEQDVFAIRVSNHFHPATDEFKMDGGIVRIELSPLL